jgi:hypothetical protein
MAKKREIICIGTDDKRIFRVGGVDAGRITRAIVMKTTPMANVYTEIVSYVVTFLKTESEEKSECYAVIPHKNVTYVEFIEVEIEKKEEKPLELRIAAAAGESDGQA